MYSEGSGREARPLRLKRLNVAQTMEEIEHYQRNPGQLTGLPTGIDRLDQYLNGLVRGRMVMLAARPGVGKTTTMLGIANHIAERGEPVAIFELEMPETELIKRLASIRCGISEMAIRTGVFHTTGEMLEEHHYDSYKRALAEVAELPIGLYVGGISTDQLWATLREIQERTSVVMVDHVGRFTDHPNLSQYQRMTYISRAFKDMRLAFPLPFVVVAQLNRASGDPSRKDPRPVLTDIRDTGAFEEDADQVIAVWREDQNSREEIVRDSRAELIVLKNRYGPTGTVYVDMSLATGRIRERGREAHPARHRGVPGAA